MAAGVVLARETGHIVVDRAGKPYDLTSTATLAASASFLPDLLGSLTDPD